MSYNLDEQSKLDLDKMIKEYNTESTTEKIRTLKHSQLIKNDVTKLFEFKKKYKRMSPSNLEEIINNKCCFLKNNYKNIFDRVMKNELDLNLLYKFINILKDIEDGHMDQHVASVKVGEILKKMYVDTALKKTTSKTKRKKKIKKPPNALSNLTWEKYKKMNNL